MTFEAEARDIPFFTEVELRAAAGKTKAGKAASPDMIAPEVVKITAQSHTQAVLDAMNDLLAS